MNNNIKLNPLQGLGSTGSYLLVEFTKKELKPLIEEVGSIKSDSTNIKSYSSRLVGQINEEYEINKSKQFLHDLLIPYVNLYISETEFFNHYTVLRNNAKISLLTPWVNFQKKYEFNPIHNHTGLISFVLWLEVPYDIEIEKQVHPGKKSLTRLEGAFNFHYPSVMGKIETQTITIDKSMVYKCIIFPSIISHSVDPFYSSDGLRISVSGNFYFDN